MATDEDLFSLAIAVLCGIALFPFLHTLNIIAGRLRRASLRKRLQTATRGKIVLTYDDGPSERLQPQLLAALAEAKARATFFVLVARADAQISRVRALIDAGHEVASHGFSHPDAFRAPAWLIWQDLQRGFSFFARHGLRCGSFRPPYGRVTCSTIVQCRAASKPIVLWTVDSGDRLSVMPCVEDLVAKVDAAGGGVVLLHSHDRDDSANGRQVEEYVLDATRALLALAERREFEVVTVADLRLRASW